MGLVGAIARGARRALVVREDQGQIVEGPEATERLLRAFGGDAALPGVMTPEASLRLIAINAAVRLKANAARSIPLKLYEAGDDGFKDYDRGRDARLAPLLHEQPNPEQPADEVWSQIAGHLAYRCNAFCWLERFEGGTRDGLVRALWPIHPRRVKVKRANGQRVYEISRDHDLPGVDPITVTPDEMLHIRSGPLDSAGLVALSPVEQCRRELLTISGVREHLAEQVRHGANFKGYLYNDDPDVEVDDEERQHIEQDLIGPGRGAGGSSHVPFLNAPIKWQQIGMSLADMQFMELMGFGLADCALLMGVPPTLLNAPVRSGSLTYRTTAEEDLRFLKYGVSPDLTAVESAIRVHPQLLLGTSFVPEFVREAHLAMDTIARYQAHALAIRAGWKTPNEVRRAENLAAKPGGDELLRPGASPDKETRELLELLETYAGQPNGNGTHAPLN